MATRIHPRQRVLLLITVTAVSFNARSQDAAPADRARNAISVEIDPAPLLLNGSSVSIRFSPKQLSHWSIMGSCFQSSFPDGMLLERNEQAGWTDLRFGSSQAIFVDYSFSSGGKGWFIGPSVFHYRNAVTYGLSGTSYSFNTLYPNLRIGYTWFPFKSNGFYFCPWVNVGKEMSLSSGELEGMPEYALPDVKYIVALHLGYRFRL